MYIPPAYALTDEDELLALMQTHSFATLVSAGGYLQATHVPVMVSRQGSGVRVSWHLAKANPQAAELDQSEVLLIFHGPHAYISPRWYGQQESVPTWNYVAVHAYGHPVRLPLEQHEAVLRELIAQHEPQYQAQWDSLSGRYRQGMLKGIVAFEMRVERLEGKAKLSQNRPRDDRARVATALSDSPDPAARSISVQMQAHRP